MENKNNPFSVCLSVTPIFAETVTPIDKKFGGNVGIPLHAVSNIAIKNGAYMQKGRVWKVSVST